MSLKRRILESPDRSKETSLGGLVSSIRERLRSAAHRAMVEALRPLISLVTRGIEVDSIEIKPNKRED